MPGSGHVATRFGGLELMVLVVGVLVATVACSGNDLVGRDVPEGQLVSYSKCHVTLGASTEGVRPPNECIAWDYSDDVLQLSQGGAEFSCCLSSVEADVTIRRRAITIVAEESFANGSTCGSCLCYRTADYVVTGLKPDPVSIAIYTPHRESPLSCEIDLAVQPTGQHCEPR